MLNFVSRNNQCLPCICSEIFTTLWKAGASDVENSSSGSSIYSRGLPGHYALPQQLQLTFYILLDISTTEVIGHMFSSYNKNNVWRDETLRQCSAKYFSVAMMRPHWFQDVALGIKERMETQLHHRPAFEWRERIQWSLSNIMSNI